MYLGPSCYGFALNFHHVYLAIPGTRLSCMKSKICLFYLYANAKSEIQICKNKHETGLVYPLLFCDLSTISNIFVIIFKLSHLNVEQLGKIILRYEYTLLLLFFCFCFYFCQIFSYFCYFNKY